MVTSFVTEVAIVLAAGVSLVDDRDTVATGGDVNLLSDFSVGSAYGKLLYRWRGWRL